MDGHRRQWWVHLILLGACVVSLFPLLRIFTVSLRPGDQIFSTDLQLIPDNATWQSYIDVVTETDFFLWLGNSVIVTALTALLAVCLSASAAYAISRYSFPMRRSFMVFLMATQMVPLVVLLLPLYFMLSRMGLVDTFAGVVTAYCVTTLPFNIWILKGYFDTIPRSLEEAARVDGLTEIGSFLRIVLPLSTPSLAIAMLYSVTQVWNEYIVARVILQSADVYTWPLGLYELQGEYDTRWGMFAAASVCVTLPVLGVFLYSARWLLTGMTVGSVKG